MKEIMISINPPYTDMILSGYKKYEFRNQILKELRKSNFLEDVKAYIYETKNKGGCGKVIGEVTIAGAYCPMYHKHEIKITKELLKERSSLVKDMYYKWCEMMNIKPNPKEGWFKSVKFIRYQEQIGFQGPIGEKDVMPNYALILDTPIRYKKPLELSDFRNSKESIIERPPQNMFYCKFNAEKT